MQKRSCGSLHTEEMVNVVFLVVGRVGTILMHFWGIVFFGGVFWHVVARIGRLAIDVRLWTNTHMAHPKTKGGSLRMEMQRRDVVKIQSRPVSFKHSFFPTRMFANFFIIFRMKVIFSKFKKESICMMFSSGPVWEGTSHRSNVNSHLFGQNADSPMMWLLFCELRIRV